MTMDAKAVLENPDCEMATKGYVKKVARKILDKSGHTHAVKAEDSLLGMRGSLAFWSSCSFVLFTALAYFFQVRDHDMSNVFMSVAIMSGIIVVATFTCGSYTVAKNEIVEYYPKSLCKYEPKEKECPDHELKLPSKP
jgi:hypothetical protein